MSISSHRSRFFGKQPKGFTIIELLVVLLIISILTTVFLLQQKRFDSSTLLRTLAYNIALSIRQAQLYGTSVRQFSGSFDYSYGVYFDSADASHYWLFADVVADQKRTSSAEDVQTFTIGSGYGISQFCAIQSNGVKDCNAGSAAYGGTDITYLTLVFKRPNPDAYMYTSHYPNQTGNPYQNATIKIVGPGDIVTRSVTVTNTGQISVSTSTIGL
jgi:prepilin-type N-terminal cleavage/methylation domain-containing protein